MTGQSNLTEGWVLLFVCGDPLTTHVFAAMDAWTAWAEKKTTDKRVSNIRIPHFSTCNRNPQQRRRTGKPLGFKNWMTRSSLKMLTSSIAGMVLTPTLLSVLCSLLSSVVAVLWTAFFFLNKSSSFSSQNAFAADEQTTHEARLVSQSRDGTCGRCPSRRCGRRRPSSWASPCSSAQATNESNAAGGTDLSREWIGSTTSGNRGGLDWSKF